MRRDPAQRYSSAAELSKDIERYLDGGAPRSERSSRGISWQRWQFAAASLAAIVLATALLFSLRNKFAWPKSIQTSPPQAAVAHSIAVLPFDNLSEETENAYFADGIQGDILTNLSKIGALKVIARASVMGYRGKTNSIQEIGKALGVSTILEGNVRRAGNRVRVNVELINTENGQAIWAENYDRDLTDVLAIQKPTWPRRSQPSCKPSYHQPKKGGSSANQPRTAKHILLLCSRAIFRALTKISVNLRNPNNSTSVQFSSTQSMQ
jgi:TolB-like protein